MTTNETQVYEIYDPHTGQRFGVSPNRYQAQKLASELGGLKVRRVWVKTIVTNEPSKFSGCKTR